MRHFFTKLFADIKYVLFGDEEIKQQSTTGYVTQRLVPNPGRIVVVRERASEKYNPYGGKIVMTEDDRKWASRSNPFAMVVGVGAPEITQYGTTIATRIEEGDKVIVGQIGMDVPLVSAGKIDYVYVVTFESIVGRLELVCGACGHTERKFAHETKCPKCGAGVAPEVVETPVEILAPSLDYVQNVSAARIDKHLKVG